MDDVRPTNSGIANTADTQDKGAGDDAHAVGTKASKPHSKGRGQSKDCRAQRRSAQLQLTIDTDPLLTVEDVAARLRVTEDWVWDHSSRRLPHLPVIRFGDGTLRYRHSKIEKFIDEQERLSNLRRKRR